MERSTRSDKAGGNRQVARLCSTTLIIDPQGLPSRHSEPQRQLRPFDRATEASSIQPSTPDANREHADQACAAIALVRVATLTDIPSLIWSKKFPTRGKCGGLLGPDRGTGRAMWGVFAGIGVWCALYPVDRGMAGPSRCPEVARRHAITFRARRSMGRLAWAMDGIVGRWNDQPADGRARAEGEEDLIPRSSSR